MRVFAFRAALSCFAILASSTAFSAETSGRWKGSAASNYGASFICNGWLEYDIKANGNTISGNFVLLFRSTSFETKLNEDGSFDGSHAMPDGIDLKIVGKAGESFSLLSTQYGCGWKEISLKQ